MKFSIIIPAFNAEDRIRRVLDSVRQQTFTDYECIVICDSCTDRTEEIAKEYGFRTEAVEFHNDGLSRSKGLDLATGEWVLFLDDDDWWMHEYVLDLLNRNVGQSGEDIFAFSFIFKGIGYCQPLSNGWRLFPAVWNKCWRREFIGNTRFPNVYSVSDAHFHMAMMEKKPKIAMADMPLYYYNYMRPGSISAQAEEKK